MCQGQNSHYFHIRGDGHQPKSVGVCIPIIRIPIKGGRSPIPNKTRQPWPWHILGDHNFGQKAVRGERTVWERAQREGELGAPSVSYDAGHSLNATPSPEAISAATSAGGPKGSDMFAVCFFRGYKSVFVNWSVDQADQDSGNNKGLKRT